MKNNDIHDIIDPSKGSSTLQEAILELKNTAYTATIYPWPDMQVGDSVLFQADGEESIRVLRRRIGVSVYHYGKTSGKKFITKLQPNEEGFRVWRTE